MSHVAKVNCSITDLDALSQALGKFPGAALVRGKKAFRMYGSESQPCVHAITVPNTKYEIGLRYKSLNPADGFEPACDFYDGSLSRVFGDQLTTLRNEYSAVVAESTLRRRGYRVTRQIDTPQQIRLVAVQ